MNLAVADAKGTGSTKGSAQGGFSGSADRENDDCFVVAALRDECLVLGSIDERLPMCGGLPGEERRREAPVRARDAGKLVSAMCPGEARIGALAVPAVSAVVVAGNHRTNGRMDRVPRAGKPSGFKESLE